jgi:hypothetical protein
MLTRIASSASERERATTISSILDERKFMVACNLEKIKGLE